MSDSNRGVIYVVWGDKCDGVLQRSILSVKKFHPELGIHVVRGNADEGLMQKSRMAGQTPFECTVYLDADTIVMGRLDYAFDRAEEFGLACSICECPWMRRYGAEHGDGTEYNTGVIFFVQAARGVFDAWEQLAPRMPSRSRWVSETGAVMGMDYDDQASFSRAVREAKANPHVLPMNWNFRPEFQRRVFAPVKVWHHVLEPPVEFVKVNEGCQNGGRLVTLMDFYPG